MKMHMQHLLIIQYNNRK